MNFNPLRSRFNLYKLKEIILSLLGRWGRLNSPQLFVAHCRQGWMRQLTLGNSFPLSGRESRMGKSKCQISECLLMRFFEEDWSGGAISGWQLERLELRSNDAHE
jgi:hypothetical protein